MKYKILDTIKYTLSMEQQAVYGTGCKVIDIDNINDHYDVNLENTRLKQLHSFENFTFIKADISGKSIVSKTFE